MLMVHRLLDALHGRSGDGLRAGHDKFTHSILGMIRRELPAAAKFEFESMPFEPYKDVPGRWTMPALSQDEMEMWAAGLIPLPAPRCYFETVIGPCTTGFFIDTMTDLPGCWAVYRFDRINAPDGQQFASNSYMAKRLGAGGSGRRFEWIADCICYMLAQADYDPVAGAIHVSVAGPDGLVQTLQRDAPDELRDTIHSVKLVIYMALMLASRSTEVEHVPAPKRTFTDSRKGVYRGFEHKVVNIVPVRYATADPLGGTHASPRLHWRRSHLRRYARPTPGSKWCAALPGPDGATGCWATVVPRHLVGSRELGEIEHEYHVGPRAAQEAT